MTRRLIQLKLISLSLILASHNIMANDATDIEKRLLADIFPTSCHFSGQFSQQKDIRGIPMPLRSGGNFFFSCDLGLVWSTTSPFEEALLYTDAITNFRADDKGNIELLSGVVRHSVSKIFLRLLKADTDYFADEFSVQLVGKNKVIELIPESGLMKKGIERIHIKQHENDKHGMSLNIRIKDMRGQMTQVNIEHITKYVIKGKKEAFDQCEKLYPKPLQWCGVLLSPWQYEENYNLQ